MKASYVITGAEVPFFNNIDFCVGTGRIGLALRHEYYKQLKLVQEKIGFKYIRGHGLLCDDMAIYQERRDREGNVTIEYNYTYLDLVMDMYLELGIRPFLELGFMPSRLASGEQTIFYWRGNVTPPKDYDRWADLIRTMLSHLIERYGEDEVTSWPIEVWNEPNLPGFWKGADMEEYFKLYNVTARAIKEVSPRFRVGGPAICGVDDIRWTRCFLEFCDKNDVPLDFFTRHHYTIHRPTMAGHYHYFELQEPEEGFAGLHSTREIIDSFERYRGMEIHITEFNTSYTPQSPLHDTNRNAAYIAYLLSRLGDDNYSYSYWTFGDVFEENGVPFAPFHGGFGLVANNCIPKPTFWTFAFFKKLTGRCVHRSADSVVTLDDDGIYRGVAWNISKPDAREKLELSFTFPGADGDYFVMKKTVDEECCNPLRVWHDMGEPISLSMAQCELLREAANPLVTSERITASEGKLSLSLTINENGVVYFEVSPAPMKGDVGFDYERVMSI